MPGEWTFEFKYEKKESLKVRKYQQALLKIREEFEPLFAEMKPEEGTAIWTERTDGKAPVDNMFGQFTYKCTKPHLPQGPDHGTWTLLWNPKKADVKNHLHARCAPILFKELSNTIQKSLVKQFPGNFTLKWENGVGGYDNRFGGHGLGQGHQLNVGQLHELMGQMNLVDQWQNSDRCRHHLPWGHCEDCDGGMLEMLGHDD